MDEVRRSVEAGLQSGHAQARLGKRAGRSLAVRPRDVQHGHRQMRIPEQGERLAHALEAELHAEVAADEEDLLQLLERHGSTGSERAARMLRQGAAAAASARSPNSAR